MKRLHLWFARFVCKWFSTTVMDYYSHYVCTTLYTCTNITFSCCAVCSLYLSSVLKPRSHLSQKNALFSGMSRLSTFLFFFCTTFQQTSRQRQVRYVTKDEVNLQHILLLFHKWTSVHPCIDYENTLLTVPQTWQLYVYLLFRNRNKMAVWIHNYSLGSELGLQLQYWNILVIDRLSVDLQHLQISVGTSWHKHVSTGSENI